MSYIDRYMLIIYWPIYEIFSKIIFRPIYVEIFIYWPIYEKFYFWKFHYPRLRYVTFTSYIGQYKISYIGRYKNVHKTLGDLAYIDQYKFHISAEYMFLYIGRYKTITYIGQYKPTSLKSYQYYIYRSIYVIFLWSKLGAYIGPIYVKVV